MGGKFTSTCRTGWQSEADQCLVALEVEDGQHRPQLADHAEAPRADAEIILPNIGTLALPDARLSGMIRPCFLVVDREFPGSISTRKLVIETAKFNVITAYSGTEAIETLEAFPSIHGVVLDADVRDIACEELVARFKAIKPGIDVVAISGPGGKACGSADHQLESFDPKVLLEILRSMQPEEAEIIEKQEEKLNRRRR